MTSPIVELQNPWWQSEQAIEADHHLKAIKDKTYFYQNPLVLGFAFEPGDFHIIRGPRQAGKTTLIKQWIERLLSEKSVEPSSLFYLSCEGLSSFQELEEVLSPWASKKKSEFNCIFLDEISFISEWQRAILSCINAGLFVKTCLVVTGSNTRDLKESFERFPGRRGKGQEISLYPLSPIQMKTLPCFKEKNDEEILNIYFSVGGFPHAVRDYVELGVVSDETYHTYQNWIIGDAARFNLTGETLKHIFFRIAETSGSRVTWPALIKNTLVKSHETALHYAEHLEDAFLTETHHCYDERTGGPDVHKARKIFLIDPLLFHLAFTWKLGLAEIWNWVQAQLKDPKVLGKLFESGIISCTSREKSPIFYWYSAKQRKEVDLVMPHDKSLELFDCKLSSAKEYKSLNQTVKIIQPQDFIQFQSRLRVVR